ncbi:MAG: signal peptidase I [Clostridia bacterium]|nr:signal peptidase I [Clostridia bacterium]
MNEYKNYIKKVNIYRKELPFWLVIVFKSIFTAFLICCFIVALFNFTHIGAPVDGDSMIPTFNNYNNGAIDYVYISRFSGYSDFDIIVIKNPNINKKPVIKRLIAMEGEKIAIKKSETTSGYKLVKLVNNEIIEIEEPYLNDTTMSNSYAEWKELINKSEIDGAEKVVYNGTTFLEIKKGYIFYMGDNRYNSRDCLDYGPISKDKVIGKVTIVAYENKNHFSYIFMHYVHKIFG